MKQKVRRALAVSGIAIAVGTTGFSYEAFAQTRNRNSHTTYATESRQNQAGSTHRLFSSERRKKGIKTVVGIAQSDATDTTFALKRGEKTYAVNLENAKTLDRHRSAIAKTDIKSGDKVKVKGTLSGPDTITASIIRDFSTPRI